MQFDKKTQDNLKVLFALIALGGKSDRVIAKALGVSNTALSRKRRKLEQEGYIKEYTIIPNFHKMGLNVVVFALASTTMCLKPEQEKAFAELMQKHPEIICMLEDQGLTGTNWAGITVHKSYDGFIEMYKELQKEASNIPQVPLSVHTAVFRTGKLHPIPFSFRNMEPLFPSVKLLPTIPPSLSEKDTSEEKTQENLKVLFALMALAGRSDKLISKTLGISNSALSRRRSKLEQEGYIQEYTVIPDFHKMGLEVIAITLTSTSDMITPEQFRNVHDLLSKYPEVMCVLEDRGLTGTNWASITVHKNYDGFIELHKKVEEELLTLHQHQQMIRYETHTMMFHTNKLLPKMASLRDIESIYNSVNPLQTAKPSLRVGTRRFDKKITAVGA